MPFARVDRIVMHYDIRGQADRPPVVFSNVLGTDLRIWDAVAARLAGRFRLVLYDQRGQGLSDAPAAPYRLDDHVRDLAALLDLLGIARAAVVGASAGGLIAQGLAARDPGRVAALVLCNTAAKIGTAAAWNERIAAIEAQGVAAIAPTVMERWFAASFRRADNPDYAGMLNMLTRTPVQGYAGTCAAVRDADLTDAVRGLRMPVLCVAGGKDGSVPADRVRAAAEAIPGARFQLMADSGHLPCIDSPEELAAIVSGFLEGAGYV